MFSAACARLFKALHANIHYFALASLAPRSVLGHASLVAVESVRLYKHRLTCSGPGLGERSVASFLAGEMAKQAGSRAVFKFVGVCEGMKKKVVMKLLSWDAVLCVGGGGGRWRTCAKILWGVEQWHAGEEEQVEGGEGGKEGGREQELFSWADACCAPGAAAGGGGEAAAVRLFLADDEWRELLAFFGGEGRPLPREVGRAAAEAQGFRAKAVGLAVVPM